MKLDALHSAVKGEGKAMTPDEVEALKQDVEGDLARDLDFREKLNAEPLVYEKRSCLRCLLMPRVFSDEVFIDLFNEHSENEATREVVGDIIMSFRKKLHMHMNPGGGGRIHHLKTL